MSRSSVTHDLRRVPGRASAPTRSERIPALASQFLGGPVGRYAVVGAGGWRPAAAFLSALGSVLVALGVLQKNHCVTNGWATPGSLWRACYSDLPVAVATPAGSSPWHGGSFQGQPPLTALVTWVVRLLVPGGSQLRQQQGMFGWGAALIAVLIAVAVCATAAALPKGPWAAAHVALSPVLVTVSLLSFDALGVALVALGLFAWHRGRASLAGVALASALLTRPTLGVALLACLVVALRRGRPRFARDLALGAIGTLVVVLGLVAVWGGDPFASLTNWRSSPVGYGSVWYVLGFAGVHFSSTVLTVVAAVGWLGALLLAWVLAGSQKLIEPEPVALLMMMIVMVTSRALPVQASLWLLPLLALCTVKWRDHLIWASVELIYFALVWTYVARGSNPGKALPDGWFAAITGARILALFFIARAGLVASTDLESERDGRPDPQSSFDTP